MIPPVDRLFFPLRALYSMSDKWSMNGSKSELTVCLCVNSLSVIIVTDNLVTINVGRQILLWIVCSCLQSRCLVFIDWVVLFSKPFSSCIA